MDTNLKKLGLTEKEAQVYFTVLEYGKVLPATVSRVTGINRTTVYAIAKELIDKRLIVEDLAGKSGYLVALPPDRLISMVEKEERDIKEKKKIAVTLASELSNITSKSKYSVPKIVFIEEGNLEEFLYSQMPKWSKEAESSDGMWGFQDHSFAEIYKAWIKWAADKYKVKVKLLSNKSLIEKELSADSFPNRNIKFYLPEADFSTSLWIVGSYVVMIHTRERPYYLVEINDAPLARNLQEVFKNIWKEKEKVL